MAYTSLFLKKKSSQSSGFQFLNHPSQMLQVLNMKLKRIKQMRKLRQPHAFSKRETAINLIKNSVEFFKKDLLIITFEEKAHISITSFEMYLTVMG